MAPSEAVTLLGARVNRLDMELAGRRSVSALLEEHIPRLFAVEYEYRTKLLEAELDWLRTLVRDIESGALGGIEMWTAIHEAEDTETEKISAHSHHRGHRHVGDPWKGTS